MILPDLKHWAKLALRPEYRDSSLVAKELERIKNTPRYTFLSTDLLGANLNIVDGVSFFYSYQEIFQQQIYCFKTTKKNPVIIDGGANIGLSIIYLKKLYPESKIFAFEADPKVFEVLKSNMVFFGYSDVNVINKALWSSETFLEFIVEGADGGRVARNVDNGAIKKIQVHAVPLHEYLNATVDFLKLDIEGAETEVILDCSDWLKNVENIFIEYHSFAAEEQRLDELLHILRKSKFRVQVHTQFSSTQPLLTQPTQLGMDLQLNIFGYRD